VPKPWPRQTPLEETISTQGAENLNDSSDRDFSASTVLVVDDLPGNRVLLKHIMEASGFKNILMAENAPQAFDILGMTELGPAVPRIDLILMDVMMPQIDGIEACRRIKGSADHQDIPVIIVTALTEADTLESAFRAGAVDYISKPINHTELTARVRSALTLKLAMDERRTREFDLERRERELLEVTRLLEETNERLRHLSTLDGLTGIPNRRRIMEFLDQEWRRSQRDGSWLSLLMIDVDYFKNYNDARGHQAGDDCLWMVANCLKRCLNRASDMVGRYGGEEFIAVLPETPLDGAISVADDMRAGVEALKVEHPDSGVAATVTISLGVAACQPSKNVSVTKLVSMADQALFQAKRTGRNRVVNALSIPLPSAGPDGRQAPIPATGDAVAAQ
jgi:diguanylate cyclase (GGDEF)-like protein